MLDLPHFRPTLHSARAPGVILRVRANLREIARAYVRLPTCGYKRMRCDVMVFSQILCLMLLLDLWLESLLDLRQVLHSDLYPALVHGHIRLTPSMLGPSLPPQYATSTAPKYAPSITLMDKHKEC